MLHLQREVNDWPEAIVPGLKQVVLAVDRGDLLKTAKEINPQAITVLRHCNDPLQTFSDTWEGSLWLARRWFSTFVDETFRKQYAQHVDFVKGYNEYLADSQTAEELNTRVMFATALAYVWENDYRTQPDYAHIRLVLCSAAVGNDIPEVFAQIAVEYDCVLSYHGYSKYWKGTRDPNDWRYFSGRWAFMEDWWEDGTRPTWLLTEAGLYESAVTGWRDSLVVGGDRVAYVEGMRAVVRDIKQTPAYREGRFLGFAVFTSNINSGRFKSYTTEQPELNRLRDMYVEEGWNPGEDAPPVIPPVEPPVPELLPLMTLAGPWRLHVRYGPGVEYKHVGWLAPGIELQPTEFYSADGFNSWARWGELGWSAELYKGHQYLVEVESRAPENDPNER